MTRPFLVFLKIAKCLYEGLNGVEAFNDNGSYFWPFTMFTISG